MFHVFNLGDQLVAQQKHLLRVKKVVAKSRARVYLEQQMLALLLVYYSKLTTCHATNLLMLRDKLRAFVSRILPP